jgi:hypothetical protein
VCVSERERECVCVCVFTTISNLGCEVYFGFTVVSCNSVLFIIKEMIVLEFVSQALLTSRSVDSCFFRDAYARLDVCREWHYFLKHEATDIVSRKLAWRLIQKFCWNTYSYFVYPQRIV